MEVCSQITGAYHNRYTPPCYRALEWLEVHDRARGANPASILHRSQFNQRLRDLLKPAKSMEAPRRTAEDSANI